MICFISCHKSIDLESFTIEMLFRIRHLEIKTISNSIIISPFFSAKPKKVKLENHALQQDDVADISKIKEQNQYL